MYCHYPLQVGWYQESQVLSRSSREVVKKLHIGQKFQVLVLFSFIVEAKIHIGKKLEIATPCFNVEAWFKIHYFSRKGTVLFGDTLMVNFDSWLDTAVGIFTSSDKFY